MGLLSREKQGRLTKAAQGSPPGGSKQLSWHQDPGAIEKWVQEAQEWQGMDVGLNRGNWSALNWGMGFLLQHRRVATGLWLHLTQAGGEQAWDFPPPDSEALSQWKPQLPHTTEAPHCGPCKELGPDVAGDSGGAWEALSSAGRKCRGWGFLRLWLEEWAGTGPATSRAARCWALGRTGEHVWVRLFEQFHICLSALQQLCEAEVCAHLHLAVGDLKKQCNQPRICS